MGDQTIIAPHGPQLILIPPCELDYERRDHISDFKGLDWQAYGTKAMAVQFARCKGFKETGMSVGEVALLYDLLEKMGTGNIVELGRNYGTSTRLFIQHIIRHGGSLESWDLKHWDGFLEAMAENGYDMTADGKLWHFASDGTGKTYPVNLRIAHSITTPVGRDDRFVKFLLIDTEHGLENALGEYMRWREYLQSGGFVAFHDTCIPGVARAIEIVKEVEALRDGRLEFEYVLEQADGFGITVLRWRG